MKLTAPWEQTARRADDLPDRLEGCAFLFPLRGARVFRASGLRFCGRRQAKSAPRSTRVKSFARFTFLGVILSVCAFGPPARSANYVIEKNAVIHADDGATLCALVVRPAAVGRRPTALEFTIYVDPRKDLGKLQYAASRGYAGVMAYTRGKGECIRQTQRIIPYQDDGRDADSV